MAWLALGLMLPFASAKGSGQAERATSEDQRSNEDAERRWIRRTTAGLVAASVALGGIALVAWPGELRDRSHTMTGGLLLFTDSENITAGIDVTVTRTPSGVTDDVRVDIEFVTPRAIEPTTGQVPTWYVVASGDFAPQRTDPEAMCAPSATPMPAPTDTESTVVCRDEWWVPTNRAPELPPMPVADFTYDFVPSLAELEPTLADLSDPTAALNEILSAANPTRALVERLGGSVSPTRLRPTGSGYNASNAVVISGRMPAASLIGAQSHVTIQFPIRNLRPARVSADSRAFRLPPIGESRHTEPSSGPHRGLDDAPNGPISPLSPTCVACLTTIKDGVRVQPPRLASSTLEVVGLRSPGERLSWSAPTSATTNELVWHGEGSTDSLNELADLAGRRTLAESLTPDQVTVPGEQRSTPGELAAIDDIQEFELRIEDSPIGPIEFDLADPAKTSEASWTSFVAGVLASAALTGIGVIVQVRIELRRPKQVGTA